MLEWLGQSEVEFEISCSGIGAVAIWVALLKLTEWPPMLALEAVRIWLLPEQIIIKLFQA